MCGPLPVTEIKVLVGIPNPKNVSCHPGGIWNPGRGIYPNGIKKMDNAFGVPENSQQFSLKKLMGLEDDSFSFVIEKMVVPLGWGPLNNQPHIHLG